MIGPRPPIVDPLLAISPGGADLAQRVPLLVAGGLKQLLLREPQLSATEYRSLVNLLAPQLRLILHARCPGARALATELGLGLHLPGHMAVSEVRSGFAGALGYSAHGVDEALAAFAQGADYVLLSPVFPPSSKPDDRRPTLGIEVLAAGQRACPGPVFALGGVTPPRARALRQAGVYGVAVLGGLFGGSPEQGRTAAAAFAEALSS